MLDFFEFHSYLYREIRQSDELWFVAPNNTLNSYRVNIPRNISDFWRQVEEIFLPMFTRKYSRKHWETYYHRALRHTTDVWFRISDFFYLFIYLFIYSFYVVRSLFPQYVGQPFFAADIVRDFLAGLPSAWFQSRMANFFTGIEKELWNLMFFTENNSNTWTITSFSFIELNVFSLRMAFLFFSKNRPRRNAALASATLEWLNIPHSTPRHRTNFIQTRSYDETGIWRFLESIWMRRLWNSTWRHEFPPTLLWFLRGFS